MTSTHPAYAHHRNPWHRTPDAQSRAAEAMTNLHGWQAAVEEIERWPEYTEQPLRALDHTAHRLGIGRIFYKDESQRFGRELASFKALGAPYAVYSLLADAVEAETGVRPSSEQLRSGEFRSVTEKVTVCVATDGNQGRGLAYAAQIFGCRCVTYIHRDVSPGRKRAMERFGAIVIRLDCEYEASVNRAREDAANNGWHFVSSTSWDAFRSPVPRAVMNAYMVVVEEALAQLPDPRAITHVLVGGGVGSIAAAMFLGAFERVAANPRFVVVEPTEADCLYRSAVAGHPVPSNGSLHTIMAGLACREVSPAAWAILDWLASDFVTIPDEWAAEAMRALADGFGDAPVVSGESAAGGMAVLLHAAEDPTLRDLIRLEADSQVLLFGLEGATDPDIYQRIVGDPVTEVFARQHTS